MRNYPCIPPRFHSTVSILIILSKYLGKRVDVLQWTAMNRFKVGTDAYQVDDATSGKRYTRVGVFTPADTTSVEWWFAFNFTSTKESCCWLLKVDKHSGGWALELGDVTCEKKRFVTLRNASIDSIIDLIQCARRRTWKWVVSDDEEDEIVSELPLEPIEANIDFFRATIIYDLQTNVAKRRPLSEVATKISQQ
jgi:hypothetical protein